MKIEQEVGGSKSNQDAYVGAERQLTVDTDNWDLRLHDGVTPGGHPILSRDNNDERYQGKSSELDGLNGFTPEKRGLLVRLGAGMYRIRAITVNTNQLSISNSDGYAGNPVISIAPRIETAHTFGSNLVVEGVLQVDGGVSADTFGTHTGPVVGSLTGNVVGNLTGDAAGNHTGSFTGDVDVRGANFQLDDGQIALAKLNGLLAYIKDNAVELGMIMIWSGAELDIPAGWALCNGLNGTPDLRDKFIVGAGGVNYAVGDTGGNTTHAHGTTMDAAGGFTATITVADHILTESEIPAHNHGNGVSDDNVGTLFTYGTKTAPIGGNINNDPGTNTTQGLTETIGGDGGHSHGATADPVPDHTHTLNNASASSLPPYYALCYIMRVPV